MTTLAAPPTSTHRLLSDGPWGPLPTLDAAALASLAEASGLTGRGGAGFPTAIKLRAVAEAGRRPVVVGNAMEGEPLSQKDAALLGHSPELVLDGLTLVGRALRARRTILALGPEIAAGDLMGRAGRRRGLEVLRLQGGFVAGQETALVNQIDGRPALPRDPRVRVTQRGVDGRPTLVSNAETLAQLALAARFGPEWFRSVGTPEDPGTSLFTISGAVLHPGVVEAARGSTVAEVICRARPGDVAAVLVGGYHGAWVPAGALDTRLTRADLAPYGASVGAGVLHVLDRTTCPLHLAASVTTYLAGESAAQCGPCLNGLPKMADALRKLARGSTHPGLPAEVERLRGLVVGRGACAHPDGTSRLVASTMSVFSDHVAAHQRGWCPSRQVTL